jgi:nitrous oxidase accessory protein
VRSSFPLPIVPLLVLAGLLGPADAQPVPSPLQASVDAASPGGRIEVGPGTYVGDLVIDRPLALVGRGRPRLVGSGAGSVVEVRADDVTIEGFDIDGVEGGNLGRDSSGIHVRGRRAVVRDCRIERSLFGVYLREADGSRVVRSRIVGIRHKPDGEKASGIHVWNTMRFELRDNEILYARDGFYIQSSSHGRIAGNTVRDVRYGLHYMYSDDNAFEDNVFANAAAGAALMYSRRIVFRRNQFLHNRGYASVGLLLKTCDDLVAEDNLIADNARGVFIEGSYRNVFRGNVIAESDVAFVIYDSSGGNLVEGNAFIANLSPLTLVGRRTDTRFEGNYWSDHREPDLDGDGVSDRPYRLTSVFDHLRGNLLAADLMAQGFAAAALAVAETMFPVLEPVPVVDAAPLASPPPLEAVPRPAGGPTRGRSGQAAAWVSLVGGSAVLLAGRRRRRG